MQTREIETLTRMRALADELCRSEDPLVLGQARHLKGRIDGLLASLGGDVADLLPEEKTAGSG